MHSQEMFQNSLLSVFGFKLERAYHLAHNLNYLFDGDTIEDQVLDVWDSWLYPSGSITC